jgi:hypothetical protein
MKKRSWLAAAALVLALPATAASVPLQLSLVPAEAKWLIHVDVGHLASITPMAALIGKSTVGPAQAIRQIVKIAGIDFYKDVSDLTIIGLGPDENDTVIAIKGRIDKNRLLSLLNQEKSPEEIKYGKHTIYRWESDKFGVFTADKLMVVGGRLNGIEQVLDAFEGNLKSAAQTPLLAKVKETSADSFFEAAIDNLSSLVTNNQGASTILKKTGAAFLQAKEINQLLNIQLSLNTESPETAANLAQVVHGLITMKAMQDEGRSDSTPAYLLKHGKIFTEGNVVRATLESPPEEFVVILSQLRIR